MTSPLKSGFGNARRYSAYVHTKEAIRRFVFAGFRFPLEAAACVTFLQTSTELLLVELVENPGAKAWELVNAYFQAGSPDHELATWIRQSRNKVMHEGQFPEEDKHEAMFQLSKGMALLGRLWRDLRVEVNKALSGFEASLLLGEDPGWRAESDAVATYATQYCAIGSVKAVEMANHAFAMAVRGLARGWKIRGSETLEIPELMLQMEEVDDDQAHPSMFNDWVRLDYIYRFFGEDETEWFRPPMTLREVVDASRGTWDEFRASMNYTQLIRDAVLSYPERAP